ncbi:8-amino-7-oxononanoate synthase [Hydrogenophaga sp. PAMC20947]|uniref:8-amino-7-oxononanoate synthase n=1 Tax=Hydrogenophaga sp. PAMC20947 TaxID=2565558 RepID=UPI00109DA091|nr:8-amino-7-oxononanoate synthase [Hydrogenophaga sp. PAMC20947]QCB46892.1 8-amino-7-oxononanoate synthase [Hydrogenophaga sp. PAMC20947]
MIVKTTDSKNTRKGSIAVTVADAGGEGAPMSGAWVSLYATAVGSGGGGESKAAAKVKTWTPDEALWLSSERTDGGGRVRFTELDPATYFVKYEHHPETSAQCVHVEAGCEESLCLRLPLNARLEVVFMNPDCQEIACPHPRVGDHACATLEFNDSNVLTEHLSVQWGPGMRPVRKEKLVATKPIKSTGDQKVQAAIGFSLVGPLPGGQAGGQMAEMAFEEAYEADDRGPSPINGSLNVSLARSESAPTPDLQLWGAIRASTEALSFDNYMRFMDRLFCSDGPSKPTQAETKAKNTYTNLLGKRYLPFSDTDAYRVLKVATEAFVMVNCGVFTDFANGEGHAQLLGINNDDLRRRDLPNLGPEPYLENVDGINMLPYLAIIKSKLPEVSFNKAPSSFGRPSNAEMDLCDVFVQEKLSNPCLLELIWSYWHEEGMQVQTMNAITRRFQNVRGTRQPDPLVNVEVNPLRPLNNLLWGYIQDEQHRLTVARRNGEYDHHYGLRLEGRAVQDFRPADSRSKFIEAFHHLLRLCTVFYKQDDNTTMKADAFGVLNALKEVHLILSQGAHSQFGDMPPTARIEMLIQQWLLSRAEFREFLPTRVMVAYPEPWMDRVDAMKKLQGWTDTSVVHFHNLAVFGEQLLLSIRYGAWSTVYEPNHAFNFARFWRPQVQGYIHAYRAATGAELGGETVETRVDSTIPSVLLKQRMEAQRRSA